MAGPEYVWDHRNRLIAVTERASAGGAAVKGVEHAYDYLNRWVTQKKTQKKTGQVPYWQSGQVRLRVSPR